MFYVVRLDTSQFLTDGREWTGFDKAMAFERLQSADLAARRALANNIGGLDAAFIVLQECEPADTGL